MTMVSWLYLYLSHRNPNLNLDNFIEEMGYVQSKEMIIEYHPWGTLDLVFWC